MGLNLKQAAAEVLNEGWDPKTDNVGGDFENLPDGMYDGILMDVKWMGPNDKGTEWLAFEFEIQNEGYEGQKYFANIFFSNEKMMKLNLKRAMKTASVLDVDIDIDDFEDEQVLVEKLKEGVGASCMIELKTNKKGTFQNFDVMEEAPF